MADLSTTLPLTPDSVRTAYCKIKNHIHRTPLLTSKTINNIASSSSSSPGTPAPKFNIYFKCENYQRIGAFKARGAFHAITHLIEVVGLEELRIKGVVTHSSGNHAQALALAASHFAIPAHIVMPTISTPSKIAGTRTYTPNIYFSGSTSDEREGVVREVISKTGAVLVPPYDHPDIILGQGTTALELEEQYIALKKSKDQKADLKVVLTPLGGGGLASGICTYFADQPGVRVIASEPNFEGGNDGEIGLIRSNPPKRVESVKTLTIADGLRTPVGEIPWKVFTSGSETKKKNLECVYSVTEEQIKEAMKLVLERMKCFIEPSGAVPLAVALYNEDFRRWAYEEQQKEGEGGEVWDIAVVLSGGNTTIEAILGIFGSEKEKEKEDVGEQRAEGTLGLDGKSVVENVVG
ncbi:uncharacterized protein I303_104949 [Kwoniella dejecticola CBS 10117]|uniref:Tryptophan synthase beta chain-like PALP domain-containing protein n=1 Tax=Kwoniella dejecticola CBS 10117 TaxID=1296121 RepID=A0A1A6A3W4_9TREE|nr:uncharacterized protein I303_05605 [Kwoniella dejecticola CBS 10117]OBR84746.1 hypothetical protein I303_05605 [Kwoniella dejecticola CBS 10117]